KKDVREGKKAAWTAFIQPLKHEQQELVSLLENLANTSVNNVFISKLKNDLEDIKEPIRKDMLSTARKALRYVVSESSSEKNQLAQWINSYIRSEERRVGKECRSRWMRCHVKKKKKKTV